MRVLCLLTVILITPVLACGEDDEMDGTPAASSRSDPPTSAAATQTPASTTEANLTPATLPTTTITFTNAAREQIDLLAEIADEDAERSRGLMFRESLPEDAGMIFVYQNDHNGGFFMKNTLIPLSIAFVAADGTIIDIQDMEPETLDTHRPDDSYRYAIEVNQGWYERNGIAVGDAISVPDEIS